MLITTDDRDAPVDGRDQLAAAALAEVGQADGDDEKGLEAFAEGDDKRLKHDLDPGCLLVGQPQTRLSLRIRLSVYCRHIRPVKSGMKTPARRAAGCIAPKIIDISWSAVVSPRSAGTTRLPGLLR